MTKVEIINIVASHYNLSNRATNHRGQCQYITSDGKMCAVGMCIEDDKIQHLKGAIMDVIGLNDEWGLQVILKEEYRGHSVDFWTELQALHDIEGHWTDEGLSKEGKKEVAFLIKAYSDDNT